MTIQIRSLVPEFWRFDSEESLSFYTKVLGFSVVQRRGDDHHAHLETGNAQIMLASWEQDRTWKPAELESPLNNCSSKACPSETRVATADSQGFLQPEHFRSKPDCYARKAICADAVGGPVHRR